MKTSVLKYGLFAVINFVVLLGLWVMYTSTVKLSELATGAGAAILATIAMAVVQGQAFAQFAPKPKWLLYFLTMPWLVVRDTFLVYRAAVKYALKRKSDGYMVAVDFDYGGDDPESSARRALVTTLTTIPPNSIVVGIDRKNKVILLHLLAPDEVPWVTQQLGAHP